MNIYNTLTRRIEPFIPLTDGKVSMYTCGPTVYNFAHIGNLRTYISEDVMVKSLEFLGFEVNRVMNVTDVGHLESDADDGEDKMLKGAQRENKTVWEVAQFYTDAFFADCERLSIKMPTTVAKATDFIPQYIEMIQSLEQKGFTYFENGNVYFDISKFPNYTQLSRMDLDALQVARREDVTEDLNKRNPQDFVLWFTQSKFDNQAMKWESPWGTGYPGWHLECSVISLHYLGTTLDIHCGGVDHVPVHHTNEIAQTESYTGKKWVNYWSHMEHLIDQTGKMSKSKGEFLTLALLESHGYHPLVYRFYTLNSHYRRQLVFSYESLDMAKIAFDKLRRKTLAISKNSDPNSPLTEAVTPYLENFKVCLADDYNISNAITVLHDCVKSTTLNDREKAYVIEQMDTVLGLDLLKPEETHIQADEKEVVEALIQERALAKMNKDYAKADQVRQHIEAMGYVIEDTKEGTQYKRK